MNTEPKLPISAVVIAPDFRLSKSRLLAGLQCPKRLWLQVHRPDLAALTPEARYAFHIGRTVTEAARALHPGGRLIESISDIPLALAETRRALRLKPRVPLYEAAFEHAGVLVRTDLLLPVRGGYRLVEVKASTALKAGQLLDCAVQAWVLAGAGCRPRRVELAHVNGAFVYEGAGRYEGLLDYADVSAEVEALLPALPEQAEALRAVVAGAEPEIAMGEQCSHPYACPFREHCAGEQPEYPVSLLPRGGRLVQDLLAEGFRDLREVPAERLVKPLHRRIHRATLTGDPFLDPAVARRLAALPYPRHYLDFEAIGLAVPIWPGTRPYEPLPFQWSCHTEPGPGRLDHAEFLDVGGGLPIRRFAEGLIAALGRRGPIFVYSGFEQQVLGRLAARLPDLAEGLNGVVDRLVDLLPLVREHYYHPAMKGDFSIKVVLPTVAPQRDYGALAEVQNGTLAQLAYLEAIDAATAPERRIELAERLRAYCKLDTQALAELVHFLEAPR